MSKICAAMNHFNICVPEVAKVTYWSDATDEYKGITLKKNKRTVLQKVFHQDELWTSRLCVCANPSNKWQLVLRLLCLLFEISGHGIIWFLYASMKCSLTNSWDEAILLAMVLLLDILVIAPVKVIFKRKRPEEDSGKMLGSVSQIDEYAFPSGHASRAVSITTMYIVLFNLPPMMTSLWIMWALGVCLSRVLLGRHHVIDVIAGMIVGFLVYGLLNISIPFLHEANLLITVTM